MIWQRSILDGDNIFMTADTERFAFGKDRSPQFSETSIKWLKYVMPRWYHFQNAKKHFESDRDNQNMNDNIRPTTYVNF